MSLREIPAYREDLYEMIREHLFQNGIYDDGLAYEVADKAARGYYARMGGVDEDTMLALLDLGFSMDFVFFLSEKLPSFATHNRFYPATQTSHHNNIFLFIIMVL